MSRVVSLLGRSRGAVWAGRQFSTSLTTRQAEGGEACGRASKQEKEAEMLRTKTPIGKLESQPNVHPAQEKDPLPEFPDGINPQTGEVGGPKGPEPTRYGDWERKGRVTDF